MRRLVTVVLVALLPLLGMGGGVVVAQPAGYLAVVDVTFPVSGRVTFADTYEAPRGGGRIHQATDVIAPKLALVYAAAGGTICRITGVAEPVTSRGYQISVCGDDGRSYHYIHFNNDRPGTDDGAGGPGWAYAPGMREGVAVARGQWLGFVGDSGNAEGTVPHLHFEITDADLDDARISGGAYDPTRLNPYPSLVRAHAEGDVGGGMLRLGDRGQRVVDWQRQLDLVGLGPAADGVFGPQTRAATTAFQRAVGLGADGVVGAQTRGALSDALAGGRVMPVASPGPGPDVGSGDTPPWPGRLLRLDEPLLRGDDIRRWQQRMRDRGWQIAVDGVYGPQSDGIARQFQDETGLVSDGIVGPATWSATFATPT